MTIRMLGYKSYEGSRYFIETTARPLEIARFRHAFEGKPVEHVYKALIRFQNSDGGFGHALEPDLRARESSILCTTVAFQVLRSTHTKTDQAFVTMGIKFFLETLDKAEGHWRIIPPSAERSPHAPWWNQTGRENEFNSFSLNPTAEILGYMFDYQEMVPGDVLSMVSERVFSHLSDLKEIKMHDLMCCLRLLQTQTLPEDISQPLQRKLTDLITRTVATTPDEWSGYNLRPLQVIDSPASQFMPELKEAVAENLDYEIASQNVDGSWSPTWNWEGAYPEDWKNAEREWTGVITVDKLLLLKRFGRIEGFS